VAESDLVVLAELLDSLNVALCLFDADDRQRLWNRSFLRFFPEHEGHIHDGEPYRDNLRRFYQARLSPADLPHIDRYIEAGIERHHTQARPYTFQHRGLWLRVASLPLSEGRRLRVWTQTLPPRAASGDAFEPQLAVPQPEVALIDNLADGVMVLDRDDRIISVNDPFVMLYGLPHRDAVVGRRFNEVFRAVWMSGARSDEQERERIERGVQTLAENLRFTGAPFELPLPGDRWVRVIEHRNRDGIGHVVHADITVLKRQQRETLAAEQRLRDSEARYRLLADNSSDIILLVDAALAVRYASPAVGEMLGWPPDRLTGRAFATLLHEEDRAPFLARYFHAGAQADGDGPQLFRAQRRDAALVWVEARVRALPDGAGGIEYVCNLRDATQRRRAEDALAAANAELAALAATDALTGLANRRQFDATLNKEWYRALRDRSSLALLMIDIDHFKPLNDLFGHQLGDAFLARVARLLRDNARRAGDVVARYGGEEFAIILPGTEAVAAFELAEGVRRAVAAHAFADLVAGGYRVTVSIGISAARPEGGRSAAMLVQAADAALYQAKRNGRDRCEMAA
jgi:diguanylate cyclase (GGDEF)-like protein/PAS domain S-box-containing protein